jgi:transglutaminase-like putative cysteine protease
MKPDANNMDLFLRSTPVIDWENPRVKRKSNELVADTQDSDERTRVLFEWVRDVIPHTRDASLDVVTCRASGVLAKGTGICYAKSHLLAAMLRAQDIPAGFCYQRLRRDPPLSGFVLHGLNGVYHEGLQKWFVLDARGNIAGCNAQYGTNDEGLAFEIDISKGEHLYPLVFHDPAPVVVETLTRFDSREDMWPHLPDRVPGYESGK